MSPFKIRPGLDPFEIAVEFLGTPMNVSFDQGLNRPASRTMDWHFYDNGAENTLSILHMDGSEQIEVNLSARRLEEDTTLCGYYVSGSNVCGHQVFGPSNKIKKFLEDVRKPWNEWTEEEIMESPTWICMYKEDTGRSTETMHSKMVMESYKNPENKWIRRYFNS